MHAHLAWATLAVLGATTVACADRSSPPAPTAAQSSPQEEGLALAPLAQAAGELPASIVDPAVARALERARTAVYERPDDAAAHGALGRLYHAHKHTDLARASYAAAHRLAPESPEWPYYLALFAHDRGDHGEAISLLNEVIRQAPDHAPAWLHRASAALALGNVAVARRDFAHLEELAPGAPDGAIGLARIAIREGNHQRAAAHLERALQVAPRHHEALYLLAMTRRRLGDDRAARRVLARLEGAVPAPLDDPWLVKALEQRTDLEERNNTANRLLAEGNIEAAEVLYREVILENPEHADALYNLGLLLARSGRSEEASAVLERARAVRDGADTNFLLAMTYLSLGQPQTAFERLESALAIEPEHALARDLMKRLTDD